jgi:hypothetical protein
VEERGLEPPWVETFKFSTDPELQAQVRDVVGLYLNPPENAIVLSVDEVPRLQALYRTARILPLRPGIPEKQTHDYVWRASINLFAALEVATGTVVDACYLRHRNTEFLKFIETGRHGLPPTAAHRIRQLPHPQHANVQAWLAKSPRITLHFTPKSGLLAQHGRDLVLDYHSTSDPPTPLRQRQGTHQRNPPVRRRLERPLPTT